MSSCTGVCMLTFSQESEQQYLHELEGEADPLPGLAHFLDLAAHYFSHGDFVLRDSYVIIAHVTDV